MLIIYLSSNYVLFLVCKKPYGLNKRNFTNINEEKSDLVNDKSWTKEAFQILKSNYESRKLTNGICHRGYKTNL